MTRIAGSSCLGFLAASILGACASTPHWVAPDSEEASGLCSGAAVSCDGDDLTCQREAAEDYQSCDLERVAHTTAGQHGRFAFDGLARVALARNHRCLVTGYDAREQLKKELLAKLPSVLEDMEHVATDGRVDLAARRAEFVLSVFRTFEGGIPGGIATFIDRARAFHDAEADRLATTFPAAAGYHACGELGQRCPQTGAVSVLTPELDRLNRAHSDALGVWFTKEGPPSCHAVLDRLPPANNAPPEFALASTHVHVELKHCAAEREAGPVQFLCGQQTATATVTFERYVVEGTIAVGSESFPYRRVFEQKGLDRALTGCSNVPARTFASAEEGVLFGIANEGSSPFLAPLSPRSDRLFLLALRAEREGDRDRADAAYAVLFGGVLGDEHKVQAEDYFERRFGVLNPRTARYPNGVEGGGISESEIGLVSSWRTILPSCYPY